MTSKPDNTFGDRARAKLQDPGLSDKVTKATLTAVNRRNALVAQTPEWQGLRERARQARLGALQRHAELMQMFTEKLSARGVAVQVAETGTQACEIIVEKVLQAGPRVIKSKSMTSEEVGLNQALEAAGAEVTETDLGELIVQLAGQAPSHVTAPAIHLSVEDIAKVFRQNLGISVPDWVDFAPADGASLVSSHERLRLAKQLSMHAREYLRQRFLQADVGISGANFLVAQSGTIALVSNEGNIALTTCLPKRHIVLAGIDKLIESDKDLGLMLRLLAPSATAQRQTAYVSLLSDTHPDMHVVLVDRGRSRLMQDEQMRDLLTCIRCGACMNVCPVYRAVSGHAYGGAYPGPIGALLLPLLDDGKRYEDLPFASSLCAACTEHCPVKIPLDTHLLTMRGRLYSNQRDSLSISLRGAMVAMRKPGRMQAATTLYSITKPLAVLHPAARAWMRSRSLPQPPEQSFRSWYKGKFAQVDETRAMLTPITSATAVTLSGNDMPEQRADGELASVKNVTLASVSTNESSSESPQDSGGERGDETKRRSTDSALLAQFIERVEQLGPDGTSEIHCFETWQVAEQFVRNLMAQHAPGRVYVQGRGTSKCGYDLAISQASLLISDTGGVVLDAPSRGEIAGVMLSDTHVVIGSQRDLVPTLSHALVVREVQRKRGNWGEYQLVVTGPSRTADVEKVLVIPAHGPRRLVVVVCADAVDIVGLPNDVS